MKKRLEELKKLREERRLKAEEIINIREKNNDENYKSNELNVVICEMLKFDKEIMEIGSKLLRGER